MINYKEWGEKNIIWSGSRDTNKSNRRGKKPIMITNHISDGTESSLINWFNDPNNQRSSAHFSVSREGVIRQFVKIEDNAWANGQIRKPASEMIKNLGYNPNWASVSIEHIGVYAKTRGQITEKQLEATINLHQYIIAYVKDNMGSIIQPTREYILKHSDIDSVEKTNCPGELFPIRRIIDAINAPFGTCKFTDIDGHWAEPLIRRAYDLGLVKGQTERMFAPDKPMTRAEAVALIMKVLEL